MHPRQENNTAAALQKEGGSFGHDPNIKPMDVGAMIAVHTKGGQRAENASSVETQH